MFKSKTHETNFYNAMKEVDSENFATQAVPHLFIISDEFAELKTQQPEFMEQLISAARIGRSLGVHLILATQKPSGVVDDQIWSNSKFRVCLKVQERADSQDMIKCPDAAELSQTGRFYLQVGFNELFALGQSAWCGAEYIPTETVEKSIDSSIQVVDNLGRIMMNVKPSKKKALQGSKIKQIVAIVKYLSDLASEERISVRPLWLEPIPDKIFVEDIENKYSVKSSGTVLNPVVGEYDDPFNQKQGVLTVPFSSEGNCLIYGATGNGKTTFLNQTVNYDKTEATAKLTVVDDNNFWDKFLETITFGLWKKESKQIKIEAEDNLSGIMSIEYYEQNSNFQNVTDDVSIEDIVKDFEWESCEITRDGLKATDTIDITLAALTNKKVIVYAKVTDYAGNVW